MGENVKYFHPQKFTKMVKQVNLLSAPQGTNSFSATSEELQLVECWLKAELPPHASGSLVGVYQTYFRQCVQRGERESYTVLMSPNMDETAVVIWVDPDVRMRVGSGQTVELS